jgi:hypothetical protein
LDRAQWERADVHERNRLLDKRRAHDEHFQALTRQAATQSGARWSAEDDALLIERQGEPAHRLATMLGRTLLAVYTRQTVLRKRGLL